MIGIFHIPRTGGFSLTKRLRNEGVISVSRFDYIMSHDYNAVEALNPDRTMTLLREPRARLISEYMFTAVHGIPARHRYSYADTVRRCDEVLITEQQPVHEHALEEWPNIDLSRILADIDKVTAKDREVYLEYGGTNLDEHFAAALAKYGKLAA